MPISTTLRIAAALAAATVPTGTADAYTIGRCSNAGEAAIDRLEIDRARVSEVRTDTLISGGETIIVTGLNLWLKSDACDGSLVLVLGADCRFIDSFTRGECTLADFRKQQGS